MVDFTTVSSPSAIQPTEDAEMRSATGVIQAGRVVESTI